MEKAVFGGGCFWCTEAVFLSLKGVVSVVPGYAGGSTPNPTYQEVCEGTTGHAEVIEITYDPKVISYNELLEIYFSTHNPTLLNRQGNDIGTQYRSVIYYTNESQKQAALAYIRALQISKKFDKAIVTEVEPLTQFYKAENYHENYYKTHAQEPYCEYVIRPKLDQLIKQFPTKIK